MSRSTLASGLPSSAAEPSSSDSTVPRSRRSPRVRRRSTSWRFAIRMPAASARSHGYFRVPATMTARRACRRHGPISHSSRPRRACMPTTASRCSTPASTCSARSRSRRRTTDAERMIAAAARARRLLAVGLFRRFFPSTRLVHDLVASGRLGAFESGAILETGGFHWPFRSTSAFLPRADAGGILLDIGVHVLDLLTWWFPDLRVTAYEDDAMGGAEATSVATLQVSRAPVTVRLSRDWPVAGRYDLGFEHGRIVWDAVDPVNIQLEYHGRVRTCGWLRPAARLNPGRLFSRPAGERDRRRSRRIGAPRQRSRRAPKPVAHRTVLSDAHALEQPVVHRCGSERARRGVRSGERVTC